MVRKNALLAAAAAVCVAATAVHAQDPAPRTQRDAPRQTQTQAQPGQRDAQPGQRERSGARNPNDAQNPVDRERDARSAAGQQAGMATDALLAHCLIVDNRNEIALAQLAQQQATNDKVKQFAQKLVQDHEQFVSQLEQFAQDQTANGRPRNQTAERRGQPQAAEGTQPRDRRTAEDATQPRGAGERRAARDAALDEGAGQARGQGIDLVQLKEELAAQCLQSTKQALSEKQGADFDKAYINQQVMMHMLMSDTLTVFARHVSGEFRTVLEQGLQTTQAHLDAAKKLHKELETASRG